MLSSKPINICNALVPESYLNISQQAQYSRDNAIKELLEKRKLPAEGWSESMIEDFVRRLSNMDSNTFPNNIGFGEREARIYCSLVARRHYNFGHGIGRSGNLSEAQPKAAGSSIMASLTNSLLLDLLHMIQLKSCESCILVPMATGMTLMLCMLTLKKQRPNAKYVLWSRIDQKSCFKSITSANLIPVIIEPNAKLDEDGPYQTNIEEFETAIENLGVENIVCIFSTTSCFAPRSVDSVMELARLAEKYEVPHLVNNAYGLQCISIANYLECAQCMGRVDMFVQSTDKNLMVPVGGSIVASRNKDIINSVSDMYAGRASSSQTLDVLMTLLSLGKNGYVKFLEQRLVDFTELQRQLQLFAELNETKLLYTRFNEISIALDLQYLKRFENADVTRLGSMLYSRGVSGARVVVSGENKKIDGYEFKNWGAHSSNFTGAYITFAASVGMHSDDIPKLIKKLYDCNQIFIKEQMKIEESTDETAEESF